MNKKVKVARLSIVSNSFLIVLKVIAGVLSGSVSIISEAIHSSMDLIAALIAFLSVKVSDNPPDAEHPYGHGKIENISGVIEALLIFAAAIWIIVEAINKIFHKGEIESLGIGSAVMLVSALINFIVSRRLYKVANETNSVALEADALHLKTDVYTSLGVGLGLGLIAITKINILDPIIAILVALFIIKESYNLLARAFSPLLDAAWDKDESETLEQILHSLSVQYHELKTRKAGNYRYVDMHIELPNDLSIEQAHQFCDEIELMLKKEYSNLTVNIHVEPKAG